MKKKQVASREAREIDELRKHNFRGSLALSRMPRIEH